MFKRLLVMASALAALTLAGCGGSDARDDHPDMGILPVNCAASAACTQ